MINYDVGKAPHFCHFSTAILLLTMRIFDLKSHLEQMTKKQFKTIDEYISTCPDDVQIILEKIRQTIQKVAPEAVELISYQIPSNSTANTWYILLPGKIILPCIRYLRALTLFKKNYPHTFTAKVRYISRLINLFLMTW
jgi:CHASE3 domain sensor protein